jgi:eukaryotic-like serine/threonine-protein kinase
MRRTKGAIRTWELEGNARFELRRPLGSGGFGAVYEVFDRERGAIVALKVLKTMEPGELYRFKQEFRALSDLAHPNLVRLYELLSGEDAWFFTMELVEGTHALSFVRQGFVATDAPTLLHVPHEASHEAGASGAGGGHFDEGRLRTLVAQLVTGLAALHRAGKMHRDVKPSNVLVTRDERVVLVDFGLAVRLSTSGEMSRSALVGTPAYLAPEIVRGQPASAASDLYAVGVLMFEALTARLPFLGSLQELLSDKLTRDAPAPSSVVAGLPPDLAQLCVDLLSRTPEARPTCDEVLARLGVDAPVPSERREIPFVGRTAERALLGDLFHAVRDERDTSVALVAGPSGMGKSALVQRVCVEVRAAAPSAILLDGRCWEQESVPYKAIDGLVDSLTRLLKVMPPNAVAELLPDDVGLLARLFPVMAQVEAIAYAPQPAAMPRDGLELRQSAFRALRDLLRALASQRPLVLVIDDLQWGDEDSGALLVDLFAPPVPPGIFFIASYRSGEEETSPCLRVALPALRAASGPGVRVASMELEPLADAHARELARLSSASARVSDEAAAAIAREAGGRPFFIRELAEATRERVVDGEDKAHAPSLDMLVQARVAELPEGARRLLTILAVAGRPIERVTASRAADLGGGEPEAYDALRVGRLARVRDAHGRDEMETYHDRIREAVVAGLPAPRRVDAYRRLAEALDASGHADVETLASYFLEGGDPARAAALFVPAAEEAARHLAFDRAARLYCRAIELGAPGEARLSVALGDALVNAGRGAEAAEAFARAAALAPADEAFELRRRVAEHLLLAGKVDEGARALRETLEALGVLYPDKPHQIVIGLVVQIAWLAVRGFWIRRRPEAEIPRAALRRVDALTVAAKAFTSVETLRGAYFGARALWRALAVGEPGRAFEAQCLFVLYVAALLGARSWLGRRARATLDHLGRAVPPARARALTALFDGIAAMLSNELPRARGLLTTAATTLDELRADIAWEANTLREFQFQRLLWSGGWRDLSASVGAAIPHARERGNRHLVRALSLRFGHVPSLLGDDPGAALRILDGAREGWWPARFSTLDCFVLWSRCDVLLYASRGRGGEAREHVERMWSGLVRSHLLRVAAIEFTAVNARARAALAFLAEGAGDAGERAAARAAVADGGRRLLRRHDALARGLGALALGGLAVLDADAPAARARFEQAEALLGEAGCDHYAAAARRRRGLLLGGDEGRALVEEAEARLRAEGARDPARLASMLSPGEA